MPKNKDSAISSGASEAEATEGSSVAKAKAYRKKSKRTTSAKKKDAKPRGSKEPMDKQTALSIVQSALAKLEEVGLRVYLAKVSDARLLDNKIIVTVEGATISEDKLFIPTPT